MRGIAKGELDPKAAENRVIVDLDKAPVNARGMVEYETDFFLLRPADGRKAAGMLLYEVNNRGRKLLPLYLEEAPTSASLNDPKAARDMGLAFTLSRGYTLAWSGWDPDAPRIGGGLATRVPVALEGGQLITRRIREEIQVGTRGSADIARVRLSYRAATTDKALARLVVRDREADPRAEIPGSDWDFTDAQTITLNPPGTKFTPVRIYELWYEATAPKVVGIGYAATRDVVAFLRHATAAPDGTANPAISPGGQAPRHTMAFGISQSGRFLRHYLELGMNKDERGERVFDGVLAHISGIGKVFANHTFAEPGRTATQHEDRYYPENWFPFSTASTADPFSGKKAALLAGEPTDPKLIETNTSTEYWQKGASLLHIDPTGVRDLALPANVRAYLIAGTQHGGRAGLDNSSGACANPRNAHNPGPALRALIVALDAWVTKDIAPPPSRVPSLGQGQAVAASAVKMPVVNGFRHAAGDNRIGPPVDWVDPPGSGEKAFAVASGPIVNAVTRQIASSSLIVASSAFGSGYFMLFACLT